LKAWVNTTKQKPTHKRAWTNMILLLDDLGLCLFKLTIFL